MFLLYAFDFWFTYYKVRFPLLNKIILRTYTWIVWFACWWKSLSILMPALLSVENRVPLKPVLGGVRDVAICIIPHVHIQWNRVCNSLVILLWLMLPRDHFVSRFVYPAKYESCLLTWFKKNRPNFKITYRTR
jgi:hypothetical protein